MSRRPTMDPDDVRSQTYPSFKVSKKERAARRKHRGGRKHRGDMGRGCVFYAARLRFYTA